MGDRVWRGLLRCRWTWRRRTGWWCGGTDTMGGCAAARLRAGDGGDGGGGDGRAAPMQWGGARQARQSASERWRDAQGAAAGRRRDNTSGSFLCGAAARAAAATAYRGLVTYTLASEPGTSLRAASWEAVAEAHGRSWLCPARPRPGAVKGEANHRWERQLGERPPEPRAVWLGLTQPVEQAPLEALRAA